MRLQLLSDLHLETESYQPEPADGAELLVLSGDIDANWDAFSLFRDWPVPVLYVAGNHEFDRRDLAEAWAGLRRRCDALGIRMLERESVVLTDTGGRRIRFVATVRWCDFDLFGPAKRERAMRAAAYFCQLMGTTRDDRPFDPDAMRDEGLACRAWLADELARPNDGWDRTVAITHFGPSVRSADPRYGSQPATASFCNADDDLLPLADLWIHGHLHCRHDYQVEHSGGSTRVVCHARGHSRRGEADGYVDRFIVEI